MTTFLIFTQAQTTLYFQFLMRLHLMDYSLLLGIHDIAKAEMDGVMQNESEDDAVEVRWVAMRLYIFFFSDEVDSEQYW